MRKRKNVGTVIRQYKYRASTDLRPLPPEVWDIARRMQRAWNALIVTYPDSALADLNAKYRVLSETCVSAWKDGRKQGLDEEEIRRRIKSTTGETKTELDRLKRDAWLEWDRQAKTAIAPFGLDYSQGPNVIERFNGCIKAGQTCLPETDLTHVQIPFVFPGSAAISVSGLYNNPRRWRIVIEGVSDGMFADNRSASRRERRMVYCELGLSRDIAVQLRVDWHRPLPADGKVKRVLLCGKKMPFRGWRWHVLFQVEQPVSQIPARTDKTVNLRICWTRFEDLLIVAQWKDDAGQQGLLCLPLVAANHQDRRTASRHPEWSDWLMGYADLPEYKDTEYSLPRGSEARMKMRERRRRVEERWQARRVWLYRNFASWLAREYSILRVPALDVKSIAEDDTKTGALAGGDRWRQVAAPGDLLATIQDIAEKHVRVIEKISQTATAFQTLTEDQTGLRSLIDSRELKVFEVQGNSGAVAVGVHAG